MNSLSITTNIRCNFDCVVETWWLESRSKNLHTNKFLEQYSRTLCCISCYWSLNTLYGSSENRVWEMHKRLRQWSRLSHFEVSKPWQFELHILKQQTRETTTCIHTKKDFVKFFFLLPCIIYFSSLTLVNMSREVW
jgi:hypothetical protein